MTDLINKKHHHFENNPCHSENLSNGKATQSVLDKFVSGTKPLPLIVGTARTIGDVKCEKFGKLIGVNCFNSNESRLIISDATSAWSKECLKVTKCQDKICHNCKELMKSDAFRKKESRVRKSENKQMKYMLHVLQQLP